VCDKFELIAVRAPE